MTAALAVASLLLATALVAVELSRRAASRRLREVAHRLDNDLATGGTGLTAAVSLVERAAQRVDAQAIAGAHAVDRLERALGAIPAGVVLFDAAGGVAYRNEAGAAYLTARHGDALVEEAISKLAAAAGSGATPPSRTVEVLGPPARTVVVRATRLSGDTGAGEVLVVVDDISARRRLEAIRRDFVANISHELKTPIGALGVLAETLVDEEDPAVARRLAERIVGEAARVGRTIDDLLALSRIEGDELRSVEVLEVDAVVGEALERIRPMADQRGIAVTVEHTTSGAVVTGDRLQLVSALANLLDNAVKYSDAGSTVDVRAAAGDEWVEISVHDHGLGIPRGELDRIFERFYRVDRARSRDTGGTGLGLAIVRHVAANHGGEVRVESQEGDGSTFTLRLPSEAEHGADADRGRMHP